MKYFTSSAGQNLLLALVSIISSVAIAIPSAIAQTPPIRIYPTPVRPEILRPNTIICGSRSPKQCEAWLKKIRAAQEGRGIRIPQPQPDPSPQLIPASPNPRNSR
ncbi:hypothetical protein CLI64_14105 [Nostoc sp. CENA543]|uniref:hypothetical protein n=1 Tax=Nostoc sp. CENA543 TaxID=1869241 RepID=UPI000CA2A655|nr:hypothetical protein [Nostoc sp. CENA543]AUT01432.1 hypothetical protein CLI64_14105 [Nostoc sp. CENA543]